MPTEDKLPHPAYLQPGYKGPTYPTEAHGPIPAFTSYEEEADWWDTQRWTAWNITHIARKNHEATPEEVEQVVFSDTSIAGQAHSGRIRIIGQTKAGRLLTVVLDPEGDGIWFCVTAHPPSAENRKRYKEEIKKRSQL